MNKLVYAVTKGFPRNEIYGLTSQIRRASIGISSNIAEGCGRRSSKDFVQFLHNAMGSLKEIESRIFLAKDLGYLLGSDFDRINVIIGKLNRKLLSFTMYVQEGKFG